MRVGLDLLFLIPGETGGRETYARELIAELLNVDPSLRATAFINREASGGFVRELAASMRVIRLPVSAHRPEQWAFGELLGVPVAGRRAAVELVHSLANFGPAGGPFRRVLTVHDLQYRALPDLLPPARRIATAALMALAARRAHRIITVSEFARVELLSEFSVDPARVDVVPNGVGATRASAAVPGDILRTRYRLQNRPVSLTVATGLPHKNLELLFDAVARIERAQRPVLIFAGAGTDSNALSERARAVGVDEDVRLLGFCEPTTLEGLYRLAACLVLPSLYEGFGLPVLEAMVRGLPVVCSDIPALREVSADAALRFAPNSAAEVAAAIERVLGDPDLARRLAAAGRTQAEQFSWRRSAQATLECYRRALASESD